MNNKEILKKNKYKYAELKKNNFKELNLCVDEQIKHCIDDIKEYHKSGWCITNKGRVWSLTDKRWLVPSMNENGYWRVANIYVHRLVCHYFMSDDDIKILKMIEEHNKKYSDRWIEEVHHKETVNKLDYANMTEEEKIVACMEVNNKSNLIYQIKKDHVDVHRIMNGKKTQSEEDGVAQFDNITSIIRNSGVDNAYVSYNENNEKVYNMTLKLKTMTLEEEEEYDKKLKDSKLIYW